MSKQIEKNISLLAEDDGYIFVDYGTDDYIGVPGLTSPERHFITAVLSLIFVTGLASNTKVIILATGHVRRGLVNWVYMGNIATVQILLLVTCLPTAVVTVQLNNWPFGNVMCKVVNYLMTVYMAVCVISLVVMTTETYASIRNVFINISRCKKKPILILTVTWCASLFTMTPRLGLYSDQLQWMVQEVRHVCDRSFVRMARRQADTFLLFLFLYVAPVVMVTCSIAGSYLRLAKMRHTGTGRSMSIGREIREANEIVKVAFVIVLTYLIGWLPVHVAGFVLEFYSYDALAARQVYAMCVFLATFAVSPVSALFVCRSVKHMENKDQTSSSKALNVDSASISADC